MSIKIIKEVASTGSKGVNFNLSEVSRIRFACLGKRVAKARIKTVSLDHSDLLKVVEILRDNSWKVYKRGNGWYRWYRTNPSDYKLELIVDAKSIDEIVSNRLNVLNERIVSTGLRPATNLRAARHLLEIMEKGSLPEQVPGPDSQRVTVNGTYFGSGDYVAYSMSSQKIEHEGGETDTGFAVERANFATLEQPGDWFIRYKSAYPGGTSRKLYIAV